MSHEVPSFNPDVLLLLPSISNWDRTRQRYGGLTNSLAKLGLRPMVGVSHDSYQGEGVFIGARQPYGDGLGFTEGYNFVEGEVAPVVVRDLTMPTETKPLYTDPNAPVLSNHPVLNAILASKSDAYGYFEPVQPFSIPKVPKSELSEAIASMPRNRVVVKPDYGSAGEGVFIGTKAEAEDKIRETDSKSKLFIVQEAIDMSAGIPEMGIDGVHNVRVIVIDGKPVFGFIRDDPTGSLTMQGETFKNRRFLNFEQVINGIGPVVEASIEIFQGIPHALGSVVALDFIKGAEGSYMLEANRKPERNSPYDDRSPETMRAADMWDKAEAEMLHRLVSESK